MGWSLGYDPQHGGRDIGYSVPAYCDHPRCTVAIDRGLAHVCGGEPYGGEKGCGLYFCNAHLTAAPQRCPKCARHDRKPYRPKPDCRGWAKHKLTDASWAKWRAENPAKVAALQAGLKEAIQ